MNPAQRIISIIKGKGRVMASLRAGCLLLAVEMDKCTTEHLSWANVIKSMSMNI